MKALCPVLVLALSTLPLVPGPLHARDEPPPAGPDEELQEIAEGIAETEQLAHDTRSVAGTAKGVLDNVIAVADLYQKVLDAVEDPDPAKKAAAQAHITKAKNITKLGFATLEVIDLTLDLADTYLGQAKAKLADGKMDEAIELHIKGSKMVTDAIELVPKIKPFEKAQKAGAELDEVTPILMDLLGGGGDEAGGGPGGGPPPPNA